MDAASSHLVIPSDADEQFAVGLRLLQRALATKSQQHDSESGSFRSTIQHLKTQIQQLEARSREQEREAAEQAAKIKQLLQEKAAWAEERELLQQSAKKAQREVASLLQFKDRVFSSLHETEVQIAHDAPMSAVGPSFDSNADRLTSAASSGPRVEAFALTPAAHRAAQAPEMQAAVDGREFFRQARSRLDYATFQEFLGSIKRLNHRQQTKQETLEQARTIFVAHNAADLYTQFEALLRNHRES